MRVAVYFLSDRVGFLEDLEARLIAGEDPHMGPMQRKAMLTRLRAERADCLAAIVDLGGSLSPGDRMALAQALDEATMAAGAA